VSLFNFEDKPFLINEIVKYVNKPLNDSVEKNLMSCGIWSANVNFDWAMSYGV